MTARRVLLVAALWLLGGCSSTVRLMPTPTLFTDSDQTAAAAGLDIGQDTTIEVLYATNRQPLGPVAARHYTGIRSDQLRLGVATLRVGDGTKTWESLQAMSTSVVEGERPKITLQSTREMALLDDEAGVPPGPDDMAFFEQVNELLKRTGKRDLLVYVHGANTDFERATAQAAQYRHFMGRDAVVLVFAWPSAGSILRYRRDVHTARRSEPALALLLERLSEYTDASNINVLAYSAGAMIASPGLARAAGEDAGGDRVQPRLGEIYYAAPDIDLPVFVENLPRYQPRVRRVTVALNIGDSALSWAQWIHRVSRAGRPNLSDIGPEETEWLVKASEREELDLISVNPRDLPGLPAGSHSFWYDDPWVSSDVLLKLRFHATPPDRGLRPNATEINLAFWTFPPDYAEQLPAVVRALNARQEP